MNADDEFRPGFLYWGQANTFAEDAGTQWLPMEEPDRCSCGWTHDRSHGADATPPPLRNAAPAVPDVRA